MDTFLQIHGGLMDLGRKRHLGASTKLGQDLGTTIIYLNFCFCLYKPYFKGSVEAFYFAFVVVDGKIAESTLYSAIRTFLDRLVQLQSQQSSCLLQLGDTARNCFLCTICLGLIIPLLHSSFFCWLFFIGFRVEKQLCYTFRVTGFFLYKN